MSESAAEEEVMPVLSEFWMELLNVDSVKPDDQLLALGGNSLVATMLANRIELVWGFRPSIEELLTSKFHELAVRCENSRLH